MLTFTDVVIIPTVARQWGYEVRVAITDDTGYIHCHEHVFDHDPTPVEIAGAVDQIKLRIIADAEAAIDAQSQGVTLTLEDGTVFTV